MGLLEVKDVYVLQEQALPRKQIIGPIPWEYLDKMFIMILLCKKLWSLNIKFGHRGFNALQMFRLNCTRMPHSGKFFLQSQRI